MEANRVTTVLFVEPSSVARRDKASRNAVTSAVIEVAEATGGRVVKSVGGKLMVLFATPDAAASAASKMHAAIDALPAMGGFNLGVHVGFHSGPVLQFGKGPSDDTVKLALRLVEQAQDGQTITSQQTAEQLNPAFRGFSRSLHAMRGRAEQLCEIASWHQKGVRPAGWSAMAVLRLTYYDQLVVCSREKEAIVIGRDDDCDLIVESIVVSRRHCTIKHSGSDFVIHDHSSNGTYITVGDNTEIALRTSELPLPEQGVIAIGEPRARFPEIVEFCYALVT
jgi:adenylate cyclase